MRCDETRPHCLQCTSRGRVCAGYEFTTASQSLRIEISTSASVFESRQEHRAFSYFQRRTSAHLSGLAESPFWCAILLRVARSDSGIRHAVVALASMHEDFEQRRDTEPLLGQFALRHYNRAIRSHMERATTSPCMKVSDVESYLSSCMLFICIEMLQSHPQSAIALIKQAVGLFRSLSTPVTGAPASMWPLDVLEALLCRFQSMAVGLIGRAAYSGTVPPRLKAATIPPMPARFANASQAKEYLDFYLTSYELSRAPASTGYIVDPKERDARAREAAKSYRDVLGRWSAAFEDLKLRCKDDPAFDQRDQRTLTALDIRRKFVTVLADFTRWDVHGDALS